ncbi:MAG: NAD(P)/FAD-dependent oxidoreductase [Alphaproteobacteria bacterium]|nr:NAD(P)/FAD-dependent oxidoreductase [Alphaproteobacteria bacterium]
MSKDYHSTDVVIIGAGPVGLFTVFQAGMLKMRCHVVDTLEMIGGQCTALYPEKPIYDIPGYPAIEAQELINQLETQAEAFSPTYHLNQQVIKLQKLQSGEWEVTTSTHTVIRCNAVIIAAGCGAFGPNRPPLQDLEHYEGSSIFYMVRRKEEFRDKNVVIAGGGDSAVDWALSLADIAKKLYVVHRRPKFRAAPESCAQLDALAQAGKIEMVIPYQLSGLRGEGSQLTGVEVATLQGEKRMLDADILLPFFGLAMELGPIADWGLELEKGHILVDSATLETNASGIFAIGDIAHYPKKLKLILCGFSEAAMACHAIYPLVHPGEVLHFEYSTTKGVP